VFLQTGWLVSLRPVRTTVCVPGYASSSDTFRLTVGSGMPGARETTEETEADAIVGGNTGADGIKISPRLPFHHVEITQPKIQATSLER
jgi:hypothetical protein